MILNTDTPEPNIFVAYKSNHIVENVVFVWHKNGNKYGTQTRYAFIKYTAMATRYAVIEHTASNRI